MKKLFKKSIVIVFAVLILMTAMLTLSACGECDHNWGDFYVYHEPTMTTLGHVKADCEYCDSFLYRDLPVLSDESEYAVFVIEPATCTSEGSSRFVIAKNTYGLKGTEFVSNTPKIGHDYKNCVSTSDNTHRGICSVCGTEGYQDHDFDQEIIKPTTCLEDGEKRVFCTQCNYEKNYITQKLSHTFGTSWDIVSDATCYANGLKSRKCYSCKTTFTEVIPKLTHNYVSLSYKEPTCEAKGNTAGTHCEHCGLLGEGTQELLKVDHSYINGKCKWCETVQPITVTYVYKNNTTEDMDMHYGDKFEYMEMASDKYNVFLGWYDENDNLYTSDTVLTSDVRVIAKWDSTIRISTKEEFMQIYDEPTKSYYIDADINMDGAKLDPITGFTGKIDGYKAEGENYVIKNFVMSTDTTISNYGIFATNGGIIKNITFKDFTFNGNIGCGGDGALGSVVGTNNGTIENIVVDNVKLAVSSSHEDGVTFSIGLFVGKNQGTVKNVDITGILNIDTSSTSYDSWNLHPTYYQSYRIGNVCGTNFGQIDGAYVEASSHVKTSVYYGGAGDNTVVTTYYGGLVGANLQTGSIVNSYSVIDMILSNSGVGERCTDNTNYGGFVGLNDNNSTIDECFARGTISGGAANGNNVGGFVGQNTSTATISSCYTLVDVTAGRAGVVGGFVGRNSAQVQNSYSAGSVTSLANSTVGGFVGFNEKGGTVTKTYTTSDSTATSGTAGIFVGLNQGIVSKSYQTNDIIFKSGSAVLGTHALTTEITDIDFSELISEVYLTDNLYWNLEGWYVGSDNNPFLTWEFDKIHDYVEYEPVAPTCTTAGFTVFECRVCGTIFIKDVIAPLGHNLVEEKDKHLWVEPTHTTDGREEYVCMHEGYEDLAHTHEVILPALGHIDENADISCTELILIDGTYYYKCEECSTESNEVLVEIDISHVKHVERNVAYVAPSCGVYDTETKQWTVEPTEGKKPGRDCSHCGYIITGCEVMTPHNFDAGTVIIEATCETEGKKEVTCSGCHYVEEVVIDMLPHNYSDGKLVCSECEKPRYVIDLSFTAISSVADLKGMIQGGNYYLTADIDLNNVAFTPLFSEDDPFIGVFLGQGYKIKNLVINAENVTTGYNGGIFSAVGASGKVLGLTIENATVNVNNVNIAQIGLIAGVNNGEISVCTVSGTVTLNLTSAVTSKTTGVLASSFNYTFGSIAGVNGKTGEINGCTVSGNIASTFNVSTYLAATNVSSYFSQLINNTRITNDTTITFGGVCGMNRGIIKNSSMPNNTVNNMTVESKVGGLNRGRTFANLTLNEGNFCGINAATIVDCTSTAKGSTLHEITSDGLERNNLISVLGVALKQEYYKIIDNTVYEALVGVIGNSTKSAVSDVATVA